MLKRIKYDVVFAKTGRQLHNEINFKTGFGAITGPNESGKSMVIEMVRYALFGSAALRGRMEDYKELSVELWVTIKGQTYCVNRSLKSCGLSDGKQLIATGTKPVNLKVVEILGFGLDVFDMSCVTMQGEIEKLGTMGAADRKRLIDSVIGMSVIEDMIKLAKAEGAQARRDAENINDNLRKPVEPVKPERYNPKHEEVLHVALNMKSEYDHLQGFLSIKHAEPQLPPEPAVGSLDDLRTQMAFYQGQVEKINLLQRKVWATFPTHTTEGLNLKQSYLDNHNAIVTIQSQIAQVKARIDDLEQHKISCPNCQHTFFLNHNGSLLEKYEEELLTLEHELLSLSVPDRVLSQRIIDGYRKEISDYEGQEAFRRELASLLLPPNPAEDLKIRETWELRRKSFDRELESYRNWLMNFTDAEDKAARLQNSVNMVAEASAAHNSAMEYETLLAVYERDKAHYDKTIVKHAVAKAIETDWFLAKEALESLRTQIKQHLVPSLSLWASRLISLMTNGERNKIVVDEDFEIMVDDQPIGTLSGSGKAVANLALRIGLGQVLTNGVLSLFIGDEIDAAMDQNRAENTANTLQTLRKDISQILLVTHKYPSADYYIELGIPNELNESNP